MESFAKLDALNVDEVSEDECRAAALALDRVDEDLATTVERFIDKSVRYAEVLLGILLRLVVQLQIEIFEVAIALGVCLACHVQNVSDTGFDELASLERTLERSNEDSVVHFKETDVADSLLAVHVTGTEVDMREATAYDLLFLAAVCLTVTFTSGSSFLLVDGCTAISGVSIVLLELRH